MSQKKFGDIGQLVRRAYAAVVTTADGWSDINKQIRSSSISDIPHRERKSTQGSAETFGSLNL